MTGELTLESTPNGEENIFFERWSRAREGKSPYKPFFFPWWWDDAYQIPANSEFALESDKGDLVYTDEELELVTTNSLSQDQIRWRRYKVSEKEGLFWQEYPEDEVTCFITIGEPVFDRERLNDLAHGCYEPEVHEQGWKTYIPPTPGERYVIGADSAAGAQGGSYSAASVIDSQFRVVATFIARCDPMVFAGVLRLMGEAYNLAEIAIERNFTGYAVIGGLGDYPNIHQQRDYITGKVLANAGWWTNDQTRQFMMAKTKETLPIFTTWDVNLVRQLRSYRYIKYRATAQTFDDLAMATMIGIAVKSVVGQGQGFQGATQGWAW